MRELFSPEVGEAEASRACGMAEGGANVAGSELGGTEAREESSTSIGCSSLVASAATEADAMFVAALVEFIV